MNVVLIATQNHPIALGLRYVSAYLKAAGHRVSIVFASSPKRSRPIEHSSAMAQLLELCRQADLVGMSLTTSGFYYACHLTEWLREQAIKAPIVWGGIHPTVAPDESLEVADAICIGEGEEPTRLLLERMQQGQDPTDIGGLAFRAGGAFGNQQKIVNPVLPLERPLDEYPFPDYDLQTHWVVRKDKLVQARPELLRSALQRVRIQTTRGCPYSCTFCNNTVWQDLYRGKGEWVRKRSNASIIAELKHLVRQFPTIKAVNIIDDLFLVRPEDALEEFVQLYNERVALPIELDVFPNVVTEAKVAILSKLPLSLVSMGIQSGSQRTLEEIYHRHTKVERVAQCMELFHRYGLRAEYHYIFGNPYESQESLIESMRFVATHHHGPAVLRVFPLMLYPGSPLYKRARADGLVEVQHPDAYLPVPSWRRMAARHNYLSAWLDIVLRLRNAGVSPQFANRLVDFVTSRLVRRCLDHRAFVPLMLLARDGVRRAFKSTSHLPIIRKRRRQLRQRNRVECVPLLTKAG